MTIETDEEKSLVTKKICSLMTSDFMADKLDVLVGKKRVLFVELSHKKELQDVQVWHIPFWNPPRGEAPSPEERMSSQDVDPSDYSMNRSCHR